MFDNERGSFVEDEDRRLEMHPQALDAYFRFEDDHPGWEIVERPPRGCPEVATPETPSRQDSLYHPNHKSKI